MIRLLGWPAGCHEGPVAAAEQLDGVLSSTPEELRQPLLGLRTKAMVSACPTLRPGPSPAPPPPPGQLVELARRWLQLQAELDQLDTQLQALVTLAAPTWSPCPGRVETAGQLLVTAGDNPQRLRSQAALGQLCGAAPIPASRAAPTATG